MDPAPATEAGHQCVTRAEKTCAESREYSTKVNKRLLMCFQKRLLAGMRESAMEGSATGHAAQAEYIGLLSLSADIGVGFIPVHLRLATPNIGLGNERLSAGQSQRYFSLPNVLPYR